MGEKTTRNSPDSNFGALAEAIIYLADQIREGCADVADGLRHRSFHAPPARAESNQMDNPSGEGQAKRDEDFTWRTGEDEIPDMRDDLPLPNFGRKAE